MMHPARGVGVGGIISKMTKLQLFVHPDGSHLKLLTALSCLQLLFHSKKNNLKFKIEDFDENLIAGYTITDNTLITCRGNNSNWLQHI